MEPEGKFWFSTWTMVFTTVATVIVTLAILDHLETRAAIEAGLHQEVISVGPVGNQSRYQLWVK